jgi:hypothetical protein
LIDVIVEILAHIIAPYFWCRAVWRGFVRGLRKGWNEGRVAAGEIPSASGVNGGSDGDVLHGGVVEGARR